LPIESCVISKNFEKAKYAIGLVIRQALKQLEKKTYKGTVPE